MKLYRNIMLSLAALGSLAAVTSCDEKDTLDGADAVYIEITPSEFTLALGDTARFSATVTNVSGHDIPTTIKWSLTDEGVAKLLGDSVLVSVPFDNFEETYKTTKLRAELPNGKYALASVMVTRGTPTGVMPVDTAGLYMESKQSYMISHDTLVFRVEPKTILKDFEPTFTIEGEGLAEYPDRPMRVDAEAGTVTIHYSAARKAGNGTISVSVGEGTQQMTGTCNIVMLPPIEGATFYGPDFAGMTTRPPCHTLRQYYINSNNKTLNINKADTIRVAVNVQTGALEDINEALGTYEWVNVEGSALLVTGMYHEVVEGHGFDCVLIVQSGIQEGTSTFECRTSTDTLTASYTVYNYDERFPVEKIYADSTEIHILAGMRTIITTFTEPMSSYGFQKPKVTVEDPTIARVGEYEGNKISILGLKAGETEVILTSYGLEHRIPLTVTEGVTSVVVMENSSKTIFAGQNAPWYLNVGTPNGSPNVYKGEWTSSDNEVAVAEPHSTDPNQGVVTGVGVGVTTINIMVLDKSASEKLTVVPALTDMTISDQIISMDDSGIECTDDEGTLTLQLTPIEGKCIYSSGINIVIPELLTDGEIVAGTYSVTSGHGSFDSAEAQIRSGEITLGEIDDDGYVTLTMDLVFYVEGIGEKHVRIDGMNIMVW